MENSEQNTAQDLNLKQIESIRTVYEAVKELSPDAAFSVLLYVKGLVAPDHDLMKKIPATDNSSITEKVPERDSEVKNEDEETAGGIDGISGVAAKWIKRNGLDTEVMSKIFSLGLDEIDLVAKKIPGQSKPQRLRSVFLLKGVAALLGSGAPRFTYKQVREACVHYDAWDKNNYSTHIKGISSLAGGNSSSGFTLTARGLTEAAELIKSMKQIDAK